MTGWQPGSPPDHLYGVGQLLTAIGAGEVSPREAQDLIEEIAELLWAASDLDPQVHRTFQNSSYFSALHPSEADEDDPSSSIVF